MVKSTKFYMFNITKNMNKIEYYSNKLHKNTGVGSMNDPCSYDFTLGN